MYDITYGKLLRVLKSCSCVGGCGMNLLHESLCIFWNSLIVMSARLRCSVLKLSRGVKRIIKFGIEQMLQQMQMYFSFEPKFEPLCLLQATHITTWWNFALVFATKCIANKLLSSLKVCMVNTIYLFRFVETPRKYTIAELSIRQLESSPVLIVYF